MARVYHVKKAQQRYETVPVLDDDGRPVRTPVISSRTGEQKVSKRGPVYRTVTREDRDRPKPMPRCDASPCRVAADRDGDTTIRVGDAYKTISPKSGPYGGRDRFRHEACPTWQVWEYSSSLSARLAQVDHDARAGLDESDADSVRDALTTAADGVREIADEKREAAQNIEEGFGHSTSQSEELADLADQLEAWADDLQSAADEVEDRPDETVVCDECDGSGKVAATDVHAATDADDVECGECDGSGEVDNPELVEWEDAVQGALAKLDEVPL